MKVADLKLNSKYWCYWFHRYLLYKGKTSDGMYLFVDFGDRLFYFTENSVHELRQYK